MKHYKFTLSSLEAEALETLVSEKVKELTEEVHNEHDYSKMQFNNHKRNLLASAFEKLQIGSSPVSSVVLDSFSAPIMPRYFRDGEEVSLGDPRNVGRVIHQIQGDLVKKILVEAIQATPRGHYQVIFKEI